MDNLLSIAVILAFGCTVVFAVLTIVTAVIGEGQRRLMGRDLVGDMRKGNAYLLHITVFLAMAVFISAVAKYIPASTFIAMAVSTVAWLLAGNALIRAAYR